MKKLIKTALITTLALLLLLPCVFSVSAATPNVIAKSVRKTFQSQLNEGYTLGYRIYVPEDYDPFSCTARVSEEATILFT